MPDFLNRDGGEDRGVYRADDLMTLSHSAPGATKDLTVYDHPIQILDPTEACTVTLPAEASSSGRSFSLYNASASYTITVKDDSDTPVTIGRVVPNGGFAKFTCDGTAWKVAGRQYQAATRTTVAGSGTATAAAIRGGILYQDASGGAVTMTIDTAANLASEFSDMAVGEHIRFAVSSNHASNTSTLSAVTGVTLVGSGAVTQLGGQFALIRTAAATFDLVRIG